MNTNEHNEQSELQKKLESVTPEQLRNIKPGPLFDTVAAVGYLAEQMQKDQAPEPLPDVERQQAINLQPLPPLTILTSSQLDAKGKKLQAVALWDDPTLNPSSPDYNPQAYKDKLQELAPQITDAYYTLRQYQNGVLQTMLDIMQPTVLEGMIKSPEIIKGLGKTLQTMKAAVIDMLADALGEDESKELLPYIMRALDSPKYADTSEDTSEEKEAELWQQLIQEARQLREDAERAFTLKAISEHRVINNYSLAFPFNNLNSAHNSARDINGQIKLFEIPADHKKPIITGKGKSKKVRYETQKISVYYGIYFAETLPPEIARQLDQTDALLYGGLDACMQVNGNLITFNELYKAMGYTRKPDDKEKAEIIERLTKMEGGHIFIDRHEERAAYKDSSFTDVGKISATWKEYTAMLHFKIMHNVKINGQTAEDAILILDDKLPLYTAAEDAHYQLADVPVKCLQLDKAHFKRTNINLAMMFYVLRQISKMKNANDHKTAPVFTYKTLYENCGLPATGGTKTEQKNRERLRNTFFKYLEYLKNIGFITEYETKDKDEPGEPGVRITC